MDHDRRWNDPNRRDAREIKQMLMHSHMLLHEILTAVVDDPAAVAVITAKLKASADALNEATNASQPVTTTERK